MTATPPRMLNGSSRFKLTDTDSMDRARACLKYIATNYEHFKLLEVGVNNLRNRVIAARMVQLDGKPGITFVIEYPLQRELPAAEGGLQHPVDMKYFLHYPGEETLKEITKREVDSLDVCEEKGIVVFAQREEQTHTYAVSHFEAMKLPIGSLRNVGTPTLMCYDSGLTVTFYVTIGDLTVEAR